MNTENTTLEIRKVPHSMNNIAKMNEHFSQFGTIVNLQVRKGEIHGGRGDMREQGGGTWAAVVVGVSLAHGQVCLIMFVRLL